MSYDDQLSVRVDADVSAEIESIARETPFDKSTVIRRLLDFGLERYREDGAAALLAAENGDTAEQPAD